MMDSLERARLGQCQRLASDSESAKTSDLAKVMDTLDSTHDTHGSSIAATVTVCRIALLPGQWVSFPSFQASWGRNAFSSQDLKCCRLNRAMFSTTVASHLAAAVTVLPSPKDPKAKLSAQL